MTHLETIDGPHDLRKLNRDELAVLAQEIREFLIESVSRTGGHLGPNLGVVELTIALHRVFDSPRDRLLWDTGHQSYVHKIITGRRPGFAGLRQSGGLSGYPSRTESVHDIVESSHASTALAYADGLARAYEYRGITDRAVIAVIGDGALTGGMAWEAMNNISGAPDRPVIIVLNDNSRSYAPTIGGLAQHLAHLRSGTSSGPGMFEQLGMAYIGPVDGHDIELLEEVLERARELRTPVLVHVITQKGRGFALAEDNDLDRMHAVSPMDPATGRSLKVAASSWTSVFSEEIVKVAEENPDVITITAAMLEPVGLAKLQQRFPDRVIDVGIAEQHAVTLAAGLAMGEAHPVVAIYATFINRAFDQVLLDVALHECAVTFVLDRAGITGDDGPSHNGMWDMSILQVVPGLRIAAPRDAARLRELLREAVSWSAGPTLLRYPKGPHGRDIPALGSIAGMDVLFRVGGLDVLIVAIGAMAEVGLGVAERLLAQGIGATVVDPRWVTPLNNGIVDLALRHRLVVTAEDNNRTGGVGSSIAQALRDAGAQVPLRDFGIPPRFLAHGKRQDLLEDVGLTSQAISLAVVEYVSVLTAVDRDSSMGTWFGNDDPDDLMRAS
jgi:1-deoxy-D-xylulose-5-phosphate synthase